MQRKSRPADDRESGDLKEWETPERDAEEAVTCPLIEKITLLPLRYGRVETPPSGTGAGMPYSLKSRPLGYRMLRDGYIYIYNESTGELKEYEYLGNELSGGPMDYFVDDTLYVCFSDIQWTERKRRQISDSPEERQKRMQRVDVATNGGAHLLTPQQAQNAVAEFAEDYQPEIPGEPHPQEREPYHWENHPYYHKTRLGKLLKQQAVDDLDDCLCLVVRDDIGVMLDLAKHQDHVVGWLDEWTESGEQPGDTERDYILGTVIESMTVVDKTAVLGSLQRLHDEEAKALLNDLEGLEDEEREEALQALTGWLNADSNDGRMESTVSKDHPIELQAELDKIREEASQTNASAIVDRLHAAVEDYYTREALAQVDQGFVDKHIETIKTFKKTHNENVKGALEGVGLGKQGINELIDRDRMDPFMAEQRTKLARWQSELALITEDRVTLQCDNRYQEAAWYFDPNDETQVEAALTLECEVLKDLCRTDEAAERVAKWIQDYPQYTRPMFHTLPLIDQSPETEPMTTYASILGAGYSIVTKAKEYAAALVNAEAGRLPAIEKMSEDIQLKAAAIGDTLSPAVSLSIARAQDKLLQGLDSDRLPPLDEIFRELSFFFKGKMLAAVEKGEVEFKVASADDLEKFREDLHKAMQLKERLREISHERKLAKERSGHRSDEARKKRAEFRAVREEHRKACKRLMGALSPIDEADPRISLVPPDKDSGKVGLSLILKPAGEQETGRMTEHLRKGASAVPTMNVLGDGIGAAIFFVQFANFVNASNEFVKSKNAFGTGRQSYLPVVEAFISSAAAGFACAQGISDSVLGARAKQLANAMQRTALKGVHVQMGRLHAYLGSVAYLAGFAGAAFSLNKHRNNWLDAVKSGNHQAEIAAVMAMIGSGGLVVTNTIGFVSSVRTLAQVAAAGRQAAMQVGGNAAEARAAVWATSGTRLASLFARLNLAGLVFTVVELGATWHYNYNNRSRRDDWLSSTPWTSEQGKNEKLPLDDYLEALARTGDDLTVTQNGQSGGDTQGFYLNCHNLPATAVKHPADGPPKHKVSLACWRVQPEYGWWIFKRGATWVTATVPVLNTVQVTEASNYLQIGFSSPPHEETDKGVPTSELALMVKIETLQPNEQYLGEVYMLWIKPDSDFPLVPVQEPPKESWTWVELDWPYLPLELTA